MRAVIWVRRTLKRSSAYKLSSLAIGGGTLWVIFTVALPLLSIAWSSLAMRTPLGGAALIPVSVTMAHLKANERAQISASPESISIHQISPQLRLVGMGRGVYEEAGEAPRLEFALFPSAAEQVLKGDSVVQLRVEAPSLELLFNDLLRSPRGLQLRKEISTSSERISTSWAALWPTIQGELEAALPPSLFRQIVEDPILIERLREAFLVEISARVDVHTLGQQLVKSEALSGLGELALKHVRWGRVGRELFGGAFRAGRREAGAIGGEVARGWIRGTLLYDGAICTLQAVAGLDPFSISGVISRGVGLKSPLCKRIRDGAKGVAVGAMSGGGRDLLGQAMQSLAHEHEAGSARAIELIKLANESAQPKLLLRHFWMAVSQDRVLIDHIKERYGDEALLRLSAALRKLSASQLFATRIQEVSASLRAVMKKGIRALLLDRRGEGPNPLLLTVIQEQLSGQSRAVVHIRPGEAEAVKPGYIFTHQEQ